MSGVPLPPDYILPGAAGSETPNNSAAVLMPDGRTVKQMQPLTHCSVGGQWTAYDFKRDVDLYGDGITGAHGGSGLSSIGGTIRLGELLPGSVMRHALKVNLDCESECSPANGGHRWPATQADSCWSSCYGGAQSRRRRWARCSRCCRAWTARASSRQRRRRSCATRSRTTVRTWSTAPRGTPGALTPEQGPDGNVADEFRARVRVLDESDRHELAVGEGHLGDVHEPSGGHEQH